MSGAFSEFGLIESIKTKFSPLTPSHIEGIGDDCAVIPTGSNRATVITTDMLVEGVHFIAEIDPYELGIRSVQVNISDVASMGAKPTAILLSIAVPQWVDGQWCERFFDGIHSCGVPLIGGDTTRSSGGLTISITALGDVSLENIKRRSGAKVGDILLVSGRLGGSAASNYCSAVKAQVEEGVWLGQRIEVGAMMDISDGLAGDIRHILRQSGVGAIIELDLIPIDRDATLEESLSGGEDYKLLLTARADRVESLISDYHTHFGERLYVIGTIIEGGELSFTNKKCAVEYSSGGFTHF